MISTRDRPILIVGYGSIGRRHLRNLQALGYKNIVLYRTGKSTLADGEIAGVAIEHDLKKAFGHKPLATIVANPSALHMPVALAAARAGSNLFLEKPISHSIEGVSELETIAKKRGLKVMVGFQFRNHPGLKTVKKLLGGGVIGRVVSIQVHWGEYLPEWHPWEDFRKGYSARKDLGGGVLLTLCHPFDYLRWLIGEVEAVSAAVGTGGGLGINVEDTADVLLKFRGGALGNVHLDFVQKPAEHTMKIIGQKGEILWDNSNGKVKWKVNSAGKWKQKEAPKGFERNDMFVEEMKQFISCIIEDKQTPCTLDDGLLALKIVLAAKKSALSGREVKIK